MMIDSKILHSSHQTEKSKNNNNSHFVYFDMIALFGSAFGIVFNDIQVLFILYIKKEKSETMKKVSAILNKY